MSESLVQKSGIGWIDLLLPPTRHSSSMLVLCFGQVHGNLVEAVRWSVGANQQPILQGSDSECLALSFSFRRIS